MNIALTSNKVQLGGRRIIVGIDNEKYRCNIHLENLEWVSDSLGFSGFFGRIRPSYNGRNHVVGGRAAVIPFNII